MKDRPCRPAKWTAMADQVDSLKQFRLAVIALVALVVLGTLGYHILEGWTLLNSLYATVTTLSTLGTTGPEGFGPTDAAGKVFTIALIVFGVGIAFWAGASLIEMVVGEQIWHAIQRKRMQKHIEKMRNHS